MFPFGMGGGFELAPLHPLKWQPAFPWLFQAFSTVAGNLLALCHNPGGLWSLGRALGHETAAHEQSVLFGGLSPPAHLAQDTGFSFHPHKPCSPGILEGTLVYWKIVKLFACSF